jgi:hypothetical protein
MPADLRSGISGARLTVKDTIMAIALNLTAPLKQDQDTQDRLRHLADTFAHEVQPALDAALAKSEIVHFARVLVIDGKYLQVLTEFDGDPLDYTEFFRKELGPVFQQIFSLVEGARPWEELNNPNDFFEFTSGLNLKSLGASTTAGEDRGYLFSSIGETTVRDLQPHLARQPAAPA